MGLDTRFRINNNLLSLTLDKDDHFTFPVSRRNIYSFGKGLAHIQDKIAIAYHLSLIQLRPGDLVIDCGANVGVLFLYLKKLHGNRLHYYAFEPGAQEYQCLLQNVKGKNCFQIALGEIESDVDFLYSPARADSSLIEPREFIAKYPVKVARIDTLFKDFIKLLKIDAEGAELEVLRGAQNILHKIKYISVDLGFERGRTEELH